MSYILFHIPHSSLRVPSRYYKYSLVCRSYIDETKRVLADLDVDKLIPSKCNKLIFKYSRIFCDVEKFKDDSKEIMSKKGMGVIYTRDLDRIIFNPSKKYKRNIIKSYYDKYYNKLDKVVSTTLKKYNKCLIIDLHSFSDIAMEKLFGYKDTPDICIGVDPKYTSKELTDIVKNFFIDKGYFVKINYPYSGTIVPNKYYFKEEKRLESIMIEINKRLYLDNNSKIKKDIDILYRKLLKK